METSGPKNRPSPLDSRKSPNFNLHQQKNNFSITELIQAPIINDQLSSTRLPTWKTSITMASPQVPTAEKGSNSRFQNTPRCNEPRTKNQQRITNDILSQANVTTWTCHTGESGDQRGSIALSLHCIITPTLPGHISGPHVSSRVFSVSTTETFTSKSLLSTPAGLETAAATSSSFLTASSALSKAS